MTAPVRRPRSFACLVTLVLAQGAEAQKLALPAEAAAPAVASPAQSPMPSMAPVPSTGIDAFAADAGPGSMLSAPSGGGRQFDPTLGKHLRATYRSETYGQQDGNLNLGTMGLWRAGEESYGFFDGQVTLNEQAGTGYNLGLGYRWMTLPLFPNSPDAAKIAGLSVWTDGTSVESENFFPQVGVSFEYLGDRLDFRTNAYIPVGSETKDRDFVETGDLTYTGNFLANSLSGFRDTALTVVDGELAGRIMNYDAWVFGGAYGLSGGEFDEVGGKIGLRGYATPDLALQVMITNDDLFDTNAVFAATWFIGRTRRENSPSGTLRDRFREPVIRNDYVATAQTRVTGAGPTLTNADGEAIRIVHVDSTAAAGGDGTFERPLSTLAAINAASQEDDIVLAHAGSNLTGRTTLRNGQTFLGEGGGNEFSVTTSNGSVTLPETAAGALTGIVPILNGTAGQNTVTLADNNRVQNLSFVGGQSAIVSNATTGSANANLTELSISNTTGDGIFLDAVDVADVDDVDNDDNETETTNKLGNVVIDQVTFTGVGGNDIDIDAESSAAVNNGETIRIDRVTTTRNDADQSIAIRNTNNTTGDTTTINRFTYNGGTTGGAILLDATAGDVSVQNSTLTGGAGPAIDVQNTTGPVSIGATTTISNVAGNAVRVNGNTGSVTVDADITTASTINGGGVLVQNNTGIVAFNGDINANNVAAVTVTGARAAVTFGASGSITNSGTGNAVTITDTADTNADSGNVTFAGAISNGGAGQVVSIDMAGGDDDVTFNGAVTESGTDVAATAQSISVSNLGSGGQVQFNGQTNVTTLGAANGVELTGNNAASTVAFNNLDIITDAGTALALTGTAPNGGILNVTGTGNTITTATGRAIDISGGSTAAGATGGVTFQTVTTGSSPPMAPVTGPVTDAVRVVDFDGTVTINDGTLRTTGAGAADQAVYVENAGLVMNSVDVVSGSVRAADVLFDGTTAPRIVTINNADLNGDQVRVASTSTAAAGGGTVNLTNLTNSGTRSFTNTGAASLTIDMTDVGGTGDTTMQVTGTSSGSGSMTLTRVNTGGNVSGTTAAGTTGGVTVNLDNSGNTTGFNNVTVNDQGGGAATLSMTNSRTATTGTGVSFTSAGAGASSMTLQSNTTIGAGGVSYTANNSGSSNASISGSTVTSGSVNYAISNTGTSTATVSNSTLTNGNLTVAAGNAGDATTTISGTTTLTNGDLTYTSTNSGARTTNISGATLTDGNLTYTAGNVGASIASISGTNLASGNLIATVNNTGNATFNLTSSTVQTQNNDAAVLLVYGANVVDGDVDIRDNTNFTTLDDEAVDIDFNGSSDVEFRFSNNATANNSATLDTVSIDVSGAANVEATVGTNTFTNAGGADGFEVATTSGGSVLTLDLRGNNANSGVGNLRVTETLGQVRVFELTNTFNNAGSRNIGNVIFDPNVIGNFTDAPTAPALPGTP
ncbi:MAG: beta strand repeat-containing protein [Lacipirellulaceae bacterium]